MNVVDLTKATVICGGVAYLFVNYPILGQVSVAVVMSVLWLSYAYKTVATFRRKRIS